VHFYLHLRGSIALTDMVGMHLPNAGAAKNVARAMLATYHDRQSIDASQAYVEITDSDGQPLELVGAAPANVATRPASRQVKRGAGRARAEVKRRATYAG
jgi:hypothetical protein